MNKEPIINILTILCIVLIVILSVLYGGVLACKNTKGYLTEGFKCSTIPQQEIVKPYDLGNYTLLNLENG